jgi:hypothetical protein
MALLIHQSSHQSSHRHNNLRLKPKYYNNRLHRYLLLHKWRLLDRLLHSRLLRSSTFLVTVQGLWLLRSSLLHNLLLLRPSIRLLGHLPRNNQE